MTGLDVLVVGVLAGVAALLAVFILALFRGARMLRAARLGDLDDDPADDMSPAMRERFDAWRHHVDEALHLANDCVLCEFDRNRRKDHTS